MQIVAVMCAALIAVSGVCVPDFGSNVVYAEETTSDFVIENGVLTKYNGPGVDVVIPEGVTTIGSGVFDGKTEVGMGWATISPSVLEKITIPGSVTSIDGSIGRNDLTIIYGYTGTYAETYANDREYEFVSLGTYIPPTSDPSDNPGTDNDNSGADNDSDKKDDVNNSADKKGDADGNNKVDLNDAKYVLKEALGIKVTL